jgi:hypothetical protein
MIGSRLVPSAVRGASVAEPAVADEFDVYRADVAQFYDEEFGRRLDAAIHAEGAFSVDQDRRAEAARRLAEKRRAQVARFERLIADAAREAKACGLEPDAHVVSATRTYGIRAFLGREYTFADVARGWWLRREEAGVRAGKAEGDIPGTAGIMLSERGDLFETCFTPRGAPEGACCGNRLDGEQLSWYVWRAANNDSDQSGQLRDLENLLVSFVLTMRKRSSDSGRQATLSSYGSDAEDETVL